MKRKRYLPNGVRSQEIRKLDYSYFSIPVGGGRKTHLINKPENYLLLKQKYPKIRKIRYCNTYGGFTFFDELANKAYVLRRRELHNHTIPIITTRIETPFKCRATRSGMVKIQPLPK